MISKIGLYSQPQFRGTENKEVKQEKPVTSASSTTSSLPGSSYAVSQKGQITAANNKEVTRSFITAKEIRIPNVLTLKPGTYSLSYADMLTKQEKDINPAGLTIVSKKLKNPGEYNREIVIKNQKQPPNTLAVIKVNTQKAELPEITYKQGKFMPELTIKDPSTLGDTKVKMLAGSVVKGEGFEIVMPGSRKDLMSNKYQNVTIRAPKSTHAGKERRQDLSFTGRVVVSTLNKEEKTQSAINKYYDQNLNTEAIAGDYQDLVEAHDPTIMIPAGGFGERFFNLTRENENKPSYKLPTRDGYRIIATSLNMAASAGVIKGKENDALTYLSQNHEINGSDVVHTDKYKTDGGAIAEALTRDIIPNNKDLIILNADIFTNADASRAYKALKTLPDAALIIPYYPANSERAKSFGLLGVEKDENENLQIKTFVEKPAYTSNPPVGTNFSQQGDYDKALEIYESAQKAKNDKGEFLANPGLYFMSAEAAKVLMSAGIMDADKTGLGANVMPKIVEMCNKGQLKTADGRPMKAYTVPLETKGGKPAVWDDIGTAEAYLHVIKDAAVETKTKGTTPDNKYYGIPSFVLEDFVNNVDFEKGLVFDSASSRANFNTFKEAKGVTAALGNIYIAE